ncbi:DNA-binding transcriptional regulator, LysR family [Marinobacter persicus]|uniref:DNA-binding transcriptional regulator, LysR family n=1 Tax=Marinobacter persicus TaxID=930118 RepID=A0A1I3SXL6_9GAMM|nr:LysR family transcriptional regulator [Marinobacter persicus]GHD40796.1 transcriptional regulator [Marinobacter persicus]SFJ63170.1 DNA-binding transcriptional regulator, LysR family [Marinobacter persicus]
MKHWDAIEAFIAVVQEGSFSAAARRLGVSPSHISRQVAGLEKRLGTPLLYRTTRSIRLSEAGETYFQQCHSLMEGFISAEEELRQAQQKPAGSLRVTCATTFGERFLAPALNDFVTRYPDIQLDLHLTNRQTDLVSEGYDLAVRMGSLKDSSLLSRRLCDRREYLCASPAYLQRHGMPHTLAELAHHNCLLGSNTWWLFSENGQRRELKVTGNWRSNSGPALLDAVRKGLGIAQLPDYYVEPLLARGELVSMLEQYRYPFSGVWLVYPQAKQRSVKLKVLNEFLIERFSRGLPW